VKFSRNFSGTVASAPRSTDDAADFNLEKRIRFTLDKTMTTRREFTAGRLNYFTS